MSGTETKDVSDVYELVAQLQKQLAEVTSRERANDQHFYASSRSTQQSDTSHMPEQGMPPRHALQIISDAHLLDSREQLNTASYVNVVFEPEEEQAVKMGMRVNLADQTIYPNSFKLHNQLVNMLANLWHCPLPADFEQTKMFAGAGTVGSTEACLLAGLALKFRWRAWYKKKHHLSDAEVRRIYPNIVISTCFQAAWEKFFLYMDVEPRFVVPSNSSFIMSAEGVKPLLDEHTIGVVCIMGNHYAGHYDPIWDIDALISHINQERGFQIGIHVDAASGGFIAPFQPEVPAWDFRLPNVLSINASGHKFGASVCGTGWVVWRHRADLSEHVAVKVGYLGGNADSYTLNFSRPASGVYVQLFKFFRLGIEGYTMLCNNMMKNASVVRKGLKDMKKGSVPRFVMMDAGDSGCLPVVAAMLNPELKLDYDEIDLQHLISQDHWYVSAYHMNFLHPCEKRTEPLMLNIEPSQAMFRIVVKSNLTLTLAMNLLETIEKAVAWLDSHGSNFKVLKERKGPSWPHLARLGIIHRVHMHC